MVKTTGICRTGVAALALFAAVCASAADRVYLRWTANTNALKQTSCASVRMLAEKGGAQRYLDLVCDSGSPATNALPVVRVIDAIAAGAVLQAVIGERPSDGRSESYALVLADALERPVATAEPVTYEKLPESAISVQTEFGLVTPARVDWNAGSPRPLERGFLVNGEDIAFGSGTGWTYDGFVLSLTTAMTYVLSGEATNNEVQIHAAVGGATAVLSNAVVFASASSVAVLEPGATLMAAANQVMMTGDRPDKLAYAASYKGESCVLATTGVTVTVKSGIPHVTGVTVSNAVQQIDGTAVDGGTAYRVLSGDDMYVYYTVEAGYTSQVPNPLVYAAVESDVTVDANTIRILPNIPYRAWNAETRQMEDKVCTSYTVVTNAMTTFENGRWYVVTGAVERGTITVGGAAHLILCDGAQLKATGGMRDAGVAVGAGSGLAIYGQNEGTGSLVAQGGSGGAGIGGGVSVAGGTVTINGGTVTATGGAAGIGGGINARDGGGIVTINGGTVTANSTTFGAGIGSGGGNGPCGTVTINGGTVTATGGANGGAGIGCGGKSGIDGGRVTINGGIVTATGGGGGAGIGRCSDDDLGRYSRFDTSCQVTINGGRVTATGGSEGGAGIGIGKFGDSGNVVGDAVTVTINGGTVTATAKVGRWGINVGTYTREYGARPVIISGGNVNAAIPWYPYPKNAANAYVHCVTVKCPHLEGLVSLEGLTGFGLETLGGYGTNDIYSVRNDQGEDCVYLWLPDGAYWFRLSNGQKTYRYCAIMNGKAITVQPLGPIGFFVNGEDIGEDGIGDGWNYQDRVLTLDSPLTYVLSGEATNNEVQVRTDAYGLTVVLSNAVVFTDGRPALVVDAQPSVLAQKATLQMAGGTSYLAATNESAALSVAPGAVLTVDLALGANQEESTIGVFNYGPAKAIAGTGRVKVNGGTFFVWADEQAVETPDEFVCGAKEAMMTGETPGTLRYVEDCDVKPCVLVGPGVTVTVKDIPHVTDIVVSNAVQMIEESATPGAYRVMAGDDIFVGYTVESGYTSKSANPLVFYGVDGDITVDAQMIPTLRNIPYRAWNETTRRMENRVCTDYTVVTNATATFEDGRWYVVTGAVTCGQVRVNGSTHLILCDGAKLTAKGGAKEAGVAVPEGRSLSIYGQAFGTGELEATGDTYWAGRCVGGAGIGGDGDASCGSVTINGGVITAKAVGYAAGIGGGTNGKGGTVTINGGRVNANGGPFGAGIGGGNGNGGMGGTVTINGGTVRATHSYTAMDIGGGATGNTTVAPGGTVTIRGGSVRAGTIDNVPSNGVERVYCVTAKFVGIRAQEGTGIRLNVGGLGNYGTNDIYAVTNDNGEDCAYLWLPEGTHDFTLSDGTTTNRYCAVVKGVAITVEPLGPVGFFVNGVDVGDKGSGDGWNYQKKVLTLDDAKTYVLSGAALTNEVQVKVAASGATVVLSNAVVFASGRPALDVAQSVSLQMAGGTSYLAATNNAMALSVGPDAVLTVGLAPGANGAESMIGVFNYGFVPAIVGAGSVKVDGGTFFAWADGQAVETPGRFAFGADEVLMTGDAPDSMIYAEVCNNKPCVLVGPGVTVTVKDIPHVTDVVVSNGTERISRAAAEGGAAYRVMQGDDVYVGYTVETGYTSQSANPLVYAGVGRDVTVDADAIRILKNIPYRAWNEATRQMEDRECVNYTVVTNAMSTFEDGQWYAVTGVVSATSLRVDGAAHLILCDGATLTANGIAGGRITVYGQPSGCGGLEVAGEVSASMTCEGGILSAKTLSGESLAVVGGTLAADDVRNGKVTIEGGSVRANAVQSVPSNGVERVFCVTAKVEGLNVERLNVEGLAGYGVNDVYPIDGKVCLWLTNGTHRFTVSDGTTTDFRYCAVVDGRGVAVEPLAPVGFFADGVDVGDVGAGDGWHYQEKVLTLDGAKTCVLSGEATNDEVQVRVAQTDATAVLSNAVVFATGRPAAVVAQGATLAIAANQVLMAGEAPEEMRYATACGDAPCVVAGPGVTVTVKDIPHVTDFTVSNAVERIEGAAVADGTAYRVMAGDDVFVGYTVAAGYTSQSPNPLVYQEIKGDRTVDADTVRILPNIPYRAWNGSQMEDRTCTNYTVVTADTEIFEGGKWYVVTGTVERGTITVNDTAHLILCDGARLTCDGAKPNAYHCGEPGILLDATRTLSVYGQAEGSGTLEALGADDCAGIGSGAGDSPTAGGLTVDGGVVLATGQNYGAGIGGSNTFWWKDYGNGGTVTVNGGRVTATGGAYAAGVGGGAQGRGAAVTIRGGTIDSQGGLGGFGHGYGYGVSNNGSLTIDGGSVKAQTAAGLAKNFATKNVYCVTAKVEGLRVEKLRVEGLGSYGTNDIFAVDGRVYLWLPDGVHRFSISDGTTTNRYLAVVNGGDVAAERLGPIGFFANGTDVGDAGIGDGWIYFGRVLSLTNAISYVLSGAGSNNEVQVNVAASGAMAVLSNAVVFALGRPAVVVAQGATLAIAANQVLLAGESPETLKYATTCGDAPCVLVGPFVPVTPGTPFGPLTTAETATNVMQKAVLSPRADVAEKLGAGSSALGAYCNLFGFAVTGGGESWFVEAVLYPEAWTNVVLSAQAATRQIPVAAIAALPLDTPTNVTARGCGVPGFYYSFYSGGTVTNLGALASEGGRNVLCGTDGDVEFSGVVKPSAAAGFFTVGAKEAPGVMPSDKSSPKLVPPAIMDVQTD